MPPEAKPQGLLSFIAICAIIFSPLACRSVSYVNAEIRKEMRRENTKGHEFRQEAEQTLHYIIQTTSSKHTWDVSDNPTHKHNLLLIANIIQQTY